MADERVLHRGRVTFEDGRGAAGALVFVRSGTAPTPEIAIRCDAQGGFRLALPPGRFEIEGRTTEGRTGRAQVVTRTDPQPLEIVIDG